MRVYTERDSELMMMMMMMMMQLVPWQDQSQGSWEIAQWTQQSTWNFHRSWVRDGRRWET